MDSCNGETKYHVNIKQYIAHIDHIVSHLQLGPMDPSSTSSTSSAMTTAVTAAPLGCRASNPRVQTRAAAAQRLASLCSGVN